MSLYTALRPKYRSFPTLIFPISRNSSSTSRWKLRQQGDSAARDAKLRGLKSRAAFKLLEMDSKYRLFKPGMTVVDLGYAPGSWSQVAIDRTTRRGTVIGIDLIPAQPPSGVTAFQGDFLSPDVQQFMKDYISKTSLTKKQGARSGVADQTVEDTKGSASGGVDVVLSDMLMNTSGTPFRDHAGSMNLCRAALQFSMDTLKIGGHFVCKFYQGIEDKAFEYELKAAFSHVFREKPDASRSESREAYFVALRRKVRQ